MPRETPEFHLVIEIKSRTPEAVLQALEAVLAETRRYGKPSQGVCSQFYCETAITTPVWGGKRY